jgi:pyruvate formate lyase activating enzyme
LAEIQRILVPSFLDGPGSRMAVFLQGCNLRCLTCHNPETIGVCAACGACVDRCPAQALSLGTRMHHEASRCQDCGTCEAACPHSASPRSFPMTAGELVARYRAWAPFLDGLTFSGGECTLQAAFILETTPGLKAEGGTVLVDTNGFMARETLEALASVVDGFLFDLKALNPEDHRRLTGEDPGPILANLDRVQALGRLAELRILVVPGFTDALETVDAMARRVLTLDPRIPIRLSAFRHQGVRGPGLDIPEPSPAVMEALGDRLEALREMERRHLT